jgi:hypothetical protein
LNLPVLAYETSEPPLLYPRVKRNRNLVVSAELVGASLCGRPRLSRSAPAEHHTSQGVHGVTAPTEPGTVRDLEAMKGVEPLSFGLQDRRSVYPIELHRRKVQSALSRRQQAAGHSLSLLSAFCLLLSAFCFLLSALCFLLPALCLLPTVFWWS